MKYILDKHIDLKNNTDSLNGASYADTLNKTIINSPNNVSFTIGLFGEWGSGKSSIVETAKTELEAYKTQKIKFIIYDAWKYANDSFRRMFLLKIQEELGFDKSEEMESFYLNKDVDTKISHRLSYTKLFGVAAILGLGVALVNNIEVSPDTKITLSIIISFLGLFATIFFKLFDQIELKVQKPKLFAPEQFEACFNDMVSKSVNKSNFLKQKIEWVKGNRYEKNIDKLVIVIDNIDRCNKEQAYQLLTDTKSFLGQAKNIVFVIPVDDTALKRHIHNSNSENCDKEAEEFLRKFFNVTIKIKPLKSIELFDFANDVNSSSKLGFNPDTIDIISREYATNPRRIIQFLNNLQAEIKNVAHNTDEEFIKEYESLICLLLIIREEWSSFFNKLCYNSRLLNHKLDNPESHNGLELFLENTVAIYKDTNPQTIEKILSNGQNFADLSPELIQQINNAKLNSISKLILADGVDFELVLKYLIDQLRDGINSKRYSTYVLRIFNILLICSDEHSFSPNNNKQIYNVIGSHLNHFIHNITNVNLLAKYVEALFLQDIKYLHNNLSRLIHNRISDTNKTRDDEFEAKILTAIVMYLSNEKLLNDYKSSFERFFLSRDKNLFEYLSERNVKIFATPDIYEKVLEKVNTIDINDENYADLHFIASNRLLEQNEIEDFFEKVNNLTNLFAEHGKDAIIIIIKHVNTVFLEFDVIKESYSDSFKKYFNAIFNNRLIRGSRYNLIQEVINSKEAIDHIVHFLKLSYSIAGYQVEASDQMLRIASQNIDNRKTVNTAIKELYARNEDIFHLVKVVLDDDTYDDVALELLDVVFHFKGDDDEYILDEQEYIPKLTNLAQEVFDNTDESDKIIEFLEKQIDELPEVREHFTNIISNQNTEDILKLSSKLQVFAYDKITEGEELFKYENNTDLLSAIAESGEKRHKIKLVKVVIRMITLKETLENALIILENSSGFNKRDTSSIMRLLEDYENSEDYSERIVNIKASLKNNIQ